MSAYKLATDIVLETVLPAPKDIDGVDLFLREYARLLVRLDSSEAFSPEELHASQGLMRFFARLAQLGNEDNYLLFVADHPLDDFVP